MLTSGGRPSDARPAGGAEGRRRGPAVGHSATRTDWPQRQQRTANRAAASEQMSDRTKVSEMGGAAAGRARWPAKGKERKRKILLRQRELLIKASPSGSGSAETRSEINHKFSSSRQRKKKGKEKSEGKKKSQGSGEKAKSDARREERAARGGRRAVGGSGHCRCHGSWGE